MSRAYTSDGRRISSMTHARRGHQCDFCPTVSYGNGGRVAHARAHVRKGEAVELVKHYYDQSPGRIFLPVSDVSRIRSFVEEHGYVELTP